MSISVRCLCFPEGIALDSGVLQVYGALSLPPTRLQMVSCIAFEKCVIRNLLGKLFISDRIAITSRGCGPAFRTVGE